MEIFIWTYIGIFIGLIAGIINIATFYPQTIPIWLALLIIIATIQILF